MAGIAASSGWSHSAAARRKRKKDRSAEPTVFIDAGDSRSLIEAMKSATSPQQRIARSTGSSPSAVQTNRRTFHS